MPDRPFLPYGRQSVGSEEIREVLEVLQGDLLTTGPMVERFERALASTFGVARAVAVSSGTAALHTAYFAAGLSADDEILTSPLTFAATANAALYLGASVHFVDVDADTGALDPDRLEEAISPRTRLIVPVDYAGHPADYSRINRIAESRGIQVVSDACHSLGGSVDGRPVGSLAEMTVASFHPVKVITTAEGGAVLTDSAALEQRSRAFRNHGLEPDSEARERIGPWYTGIEELGFNYRLSDLQCALGLAQLARLEGFVTRRRAIARRYDEAFADLEGVELPIVRPGVLPAWHLYVIQVPEDRRRALFEALRRAGLGVQVHYLPVYLHPYYQRLGYREGLCPIAERRYRRSLSLPIYPGMSEADVDSVIERVRRAVEEIL